jgi:hypothetical protein
MILYFYSTGHRLYALLLTNTLGCCKVSSRSLPVKIWLVWKGMSGTNTLATFQMLLLTSLVGTWPHLQILADDGKNNDGQRINSL